MLAHAVWQPHILLNIQQRLKGELLDLYNKYHHSIRFPAWLDHSTLCKNQEELTALLLFHPTILNPFLIYIVLNFVCVCLFVLV